TQSVKISFFQTISKIAHRPPKNSSIFTDATVLNTQRTFHKFGRHPQQTCEDHPKCCPCTSNGNCNGNSGNISQPNCSRNCCGQGLKMSDLPRSIRIVIFSFCQIDGMFKSA